MKAEGIKGEVKGKEEKRRRKTKKGKEGHGKEKRRRRTGEAKTTGRRKIRKG